MNDLFPVLFLLPSWTSLNRDIESVSILILNLTYSSALRQPLQETWKSLPSNDDNSLRFAVFLQTSWVHIGMHMGTLTQNKHGCGVVGGSAVYWQEQASIPAALWYPAVPHCSKPRMDRMANHYPCITAEWVGRGWNMGVEGGGHWAAALVQVGGAEVIHFKGKINDTINPCLGHCRGGRGRIHTRCWLPRACSTHTHKVC